MREWLRKQLKGTAWLSAVSSQSGRDARGWEHAPSHQPTSPPLHQPTAPPSHHPTIPPSHHPIYPTIPLSHQSS